MALVSHVCVRCVATPTSPESPNSAPLPDPRQTKVLLPKKKPQKWSTGVAPGEYGGPPTTTKLRKYWGGDDEDPLASDDYMWNKEFMGRFQKLIEEPNAQPPPAKEEPSGFLSLNRVMSLDSLEVDLSKELAAPVNHNAHLQIDAETNVTGSNRVRYKSAPTRREQEKWDRATKAATGGSDVMFREIRQSREDPKVLAAQAEEQYNKLKRKLQIFTLGIGGVGLVSAYVSYSPEIAARGAIGQPRLLVPVVLVMVYNRWNAILVPEFGSMHLELIPMLVGFFTYKIATFAQAIEEAITVATRKT
ncbi:protein CONSERVED ONLY IN THE GREEN LINEAGE 160, chloroplastic isoform X2 [Glycine soja]|uniref:protein CONSERVED ONLY IN THE GREEN LINEAGE 160, chloroplastic isoform X2 n=1 Tax=Glycine soja TaxID=3848 RepID=UPI0010398974|nr:protein CONSERVED ONLY IN THE GREEN LINEAGE 160, chloroplastic isoform X2 [Glycine soja]